MAAVEAAPDCLAAVTVYPAGNRDLFRLAHREGGGGLALGVAAIRFFYYIYSSAGFALGLAAHGLHRLRGEAPGRRQEH